jgi:hypothetical protein
MELPELPKYNKGVVRVTFNFTFRVAGGTINLLVFYKKWSI